MTEYLLFTPGPLSTTDTVKQAMMKDWCVIDQDFNHDIAQDVRQKLTQLACGQNSQSSYDTVLLSGSETHGLEAVMGSLQANSKLLIINNGSNGQHIVNIAERLKLNHHNYQLTYNEKIDTSRIDRLLAGDSQITHLVMTHVEPSNGALNPLEAICHLVKQHQRQIIIDASYSFGGCDINLPKLDIDMLIAGPNHSLQAIAGISFVIAKKSSLTACQNNQASYSLDLYAQWQAQQTNQWLFTCPAQIISALHQALIELEEEGGIKARALRYGVNQKLLCQGMIEQDFQPIIDKEQQSTILTAFYAPTHKSYAFEHFYQLLKHQGFIIYSGAIDNQDTFRIANIGNIYPADIKSLLVTIEKCRYWLRE